MFKWLLRIVVGLIAVVALAVGGATVSFFLWKSNIARALEADSEIIATERGDIEVAVAGEGTPVLYLHGTPGGYDQVSFGRRIAPENYDGWRTIAVSRPGYLRTPLSSGRTFEEQADLFAALLDELEIDRVIVYAASGGGYAGLQFALRHPDRCSGLILYAPSVSYEPLPEDWSGVDSSGLGEELVMWAASGPLMSVFGTRAISELDTSDAKQVALAQGLAASVVPVNARAAGRENDLRQRSDPAVDEWPLARITAPTLILHGNADENSAYEGSVRVAASIPNAELITFDDGDHFITVTRADEVHAHVLRFVTQLAD
ncbi:MAG: alpha/beta hydrolase [Maricaulaceae bacterium]|jgi:pimeloyl-ACP methyl ester carboxylesterase